MDLPLPRGTHLIHIGPQKTGTTSLQGAFHRNRVALAEHGVHYAGPTRQPRAAAAAVTFGKVLPGHPEDSADKWPALVEEIRTSTADRVVVSAEMFANAEPSAVREIIDAIGGDRPHVVITLRPLLRILPSHWQQQVQGDRTTSYDDWLRLALADKPSKSGGQLFWRRQRHDKLARRWAKVVGVDNVTVIALNEQRRDMSYRSFERLLDLPGGMLVPDERNNRSLTLPEAEMLREFNIQYEERGWSQGLYARSIKRMLEFLRERPVPPDEPRITTPTWAAERADRIQVKIIDGLRRSGVNVLGDLDDLRVPVVPAETDNMVDEISIDASARAVIGAFEQTQIRPRAQLSGGTGPGTAAEPSTKDILRTLAGRARTRLRSRRVH